MNSIGKSNPTISASGKMNSAAQHNNTSYLTYRRKTIIDPNKLLLTGLSKKWKNFCTEFKQMMRLFYLIIPNLNIRS